MTRDEAIALLTAAVYDEGPSSRHHRETMALHRAEWPTLWRAIDAVLGAAR